VDVFPYAPAGIFGGFGMPPPNNYIDNSMIEVLTQISK
jgi:hypothetical protein